MRIGEVRDRLFEMSVERGNDESAHLAHQRRRRYKGRRRYPGRSRLDIGGAGLCVALLVALVLLPWVLFVVEHERLPDGRGEIGNWLLGWGAER